MLDILKPLQKKLKNENGVLWANQFDNLSNKKSHYLTTGPEIWEQLSGKVDAFICSVGTGGTLSGTSEFLREKNKSIKIGLADPFGSAIHNYIKKVFLSQKVIQLPKVLDKEGLLKILRIQK